jgi:hypothetical protein
MSRAMTTRTVGDQITTLLTRFTLTTAARELVSRFVHAEQQPALPLLLDVLELEAQERHERRIKRLRGASKLPPGKTFATLGRRPVAAGAGAAARPSAAAAGASATAGSPRARSPRATRAPHYPVAPGVQAPTGENVRHT